MKRLLMREVDVDAFTVLFVCMFAIAIMAIVATV